MLAWLVVGLICYIPANLLPMLKTRTLGREQDNTIVGGVIELVHHGAWDVGGDRLRRQRRDPGHQVRGHPLPRLLDPLPRHRSPIHTRIHLYEAVEFIGRWSMIDVFVVAILTALVQLGFIASINPGPAAVFFALSVAFTMLSAQALDPRLIWDSAERETPTMAETDPPTPVIEAPKPEPSSRGISPVWLVPLFALVIALGVAWRTYSERGPLIEIVFDNAAGVEAGQTTLRFRDVHGRRGREDLDFTPDLQQGRRHRPHRQGRGALSSTTDAKFWVVRPSVTAQGVTGIETVISGVYIEAYWDDDDRPARSTASRRCRARRSPRPTSRACASGCARPTAAR